MEPIWKIRISSAIRRCPRLLSVCPQQKRIDDIRVTPDLDQEYKNGSLDINLNLKGSANVALELLDARNQVVASTEVKGSERSAQL